ncbi:MAG: hypothetical protein U5L11_09990 [Arhodomonas sp.]|nr:hypothetical protein [Arhodomonas sp.]
MRVSELIAALGEGRRIHGDAIITEVSCRLPPGRGGRAVRGPAR